MSFNKIDIFDNDFSIYSQFTGDKKKTTKSWE